MGAGLHYSSLNANGGPMSDPLFVLTTMPDAEKAAALAGGLVQQGLAACVNILPGVTSVYAWRGNIERDTEVLMLVKTRQQRYAALEAAIREQHPYELPELIAVPITTGLPEYLAWIDQCTDSP